LREHLAHEQGHGRLDEVILFENGEAHLLDIAAEVLEERRRVLDGRHDLAIGPARSPHPPANRRDRPARNHAVRGVGVPAWMA